MRQKFEGAAVHLIRAGFRDHIDDAAAVISILRVEVVCKHAEFSDRVEIRNNCGSPVHQLFDVPSVDEVAVGVFALATA